MMNRYLYSKGGLVLSNIARDCLALEVGDKLPTIQSYTVYFSASRGVVQEALSRLKDAGAIAIETGGVKGSTLTSINYDKLVPFTGWHALGVSMPFPLSKDMLSLSTAMQLAMDNLPIPSAFSYTSGSLQRLQLLEDLAFDLIVLSEEDAKVYFRTHKWLHPPIILKKASYSKPYVLISKYPTLEFPPGARVLLDAVDSDQARITREVFEGSPVRIISKPYQEFYRILAEDIADVVVTREEEWTYSLSPRVYFKHQLTELLPCYQEPRSTPAILTSSQNYGIRPLLEKYLTIEDIAAFQQQLNDGILPHRI